jgi:uncharacterized protein (TIGR00369 family)
VTGFHDPDAGRDVARYLGLTLRETGEIRSGGAEVTGHVQELAHLLLPDGTCSTGALAGLVDSVGGLCGGLAVLPRWVVSTNLMLRTFPAPVAGPLSLHAEVRRTGRAAVVTEITVLDADGGRQLGLATLTSAVLRPADGPPRYERPLLLVAPPPPDAPPMRDFLAVEVTDDRTLALALRDELRNPWGILHGAVTAALVDLTAVHAAAGARRGTTTDMVLHFMNPGRVGPVVATATTVGTRADGTLMQVELRDRGADDRIMAVAVTTVG